MNLVVRVLCLLIALVVSACTSMRIEDFFTGYAQQMNQVKQAQQQGDYQRALSSLPMLNQSHNHYNLTLLERGRLNFLAKDHLKSQQAFEQAYNIIEKQQAKANLQISRGLQNVGATFSNDSAIGYIIPPYEQSMLHSYQALNFAFQKNVEAAMVEIRRANFVQEAALKDNEAELLAAQKGLSQQGLSLPDLYSAYPSMNDVIGDVKNGFQNAYTFYLSAVFYEAIGELDSAYIDYKRAIDIFPHNTVVQHDVLRLAQQLNRENELTSFSQQFGVALDNIKKVNQNQGQVVVLYEQGIIAEKQEVGLNLPVYTRHDDLRFFSFSLPVYRTQPIDKQEISISLDENTWRTENIVTLQSLASKTLSEQLPEMVTRQAVRLIAKEQFRRKMKKEGGDIGNILSGLYNLASEHADTRSWLTLPENIQIARFSLPAGQHQLLLEHQNGQSIINIGINSGRMTLINVSALSGKTDVSTVEI